MISRLLTQKISLRLQDFPAVALLGPRQCGKSTLVRHLLDPKPFHYLDLEKPSDRAKLQDPEAYFKMTPGRLVCLDEIQRMPEIFPVLRSVLDETGENGRLLILGSASPELIRRSSESLAGRISHMELTPLLLPEAAETLPDPDAALRRLWLRGGFPRSFLARSDASSLTWREDFIRTFLEMDIPNLGLRIPSETLRRFWLMCAHHHGQILNSFQLAQSLGLSHTTVRSYVDILSQAFVLRVLYPCERNLKKRLVRSPKIYIRDSGLLHALLRLGSDQDLLGHPAYGPSWEGLVIESISTVLGEGWRAGFYRTSAGSKMDLVMEKGSRRLAFECKASSAPTVTRGFWSAVSDIQAEKNFVVAPVPQAYPLGPNTEVAPLAEVLARLRTES